MNYSALLETAYISLENCPINEIEHYKNICDNLASLNRIGFVKFEGRSPIHEFVFNECMEAGLTEVDFYFVSQRFDFYMCNGLDKYASLANALSDVAGNMNNEK